MLDSIQFSVVALVILHLNVKTKRWLTTNMILGTTPNISFFSPLVEQLVWCLFLFKQDLFHWLELNIWHLSNLAITQFKAIFLGHVTLVSHQKRLGKNLRFEKRKKNFRLQDLLRCNKAYTALTVHIDWK